MVVAQEGSDVSGMPPSMVYTTVASTYAMLRSHPNQWYSKNRLIQDAGVPWQVVNFAYEQLSVLPRIETRYCGGYQIRFVNRAVVEAIEGCEKADEAEREAKQRDEDAERHASFTLRE
ncbi:MAG: hypothetical protein ACP5FL_03900 [Thermoplasmatota archaeon]